MSDNSALSHPTHSKRGDDRARLRVVEAPPATEASVGDVLSRYSGYLARSPLSDATRRAYERHVRQYVLFLKEMSEGDEGALTDPFSRDYAVRDYRSLLKERRLAPASINAALAAIDHLYRFLGLGAPRVPRDQLPQQAPLALTDDGLRRVLRAVERRGNSRDRAAVALMTFAGLRVSEVANLDISDLAVSARKGTVTIRRGKGDVARTVPLSAETRDALSIWLLSRAKLEHDLEAPLFTNSIGDRLSIRGLSRVVHTIGLSAGVKLSPHVLRHTFVTRLVRSGLDVVLVAELAGHRSLETTRRYALPTAEDRAVAVEAASIEY